MAPTKVLSYALLLTLIVVDVALFLAGAPGLVKLIALVISLVVIPKIVRVGSRDRRNEL